MRLGNVFEEWRHPERYGHLPTWKDPIIRVIVGGVLTMVLAEVLLLVAVWENWL
jgi:hypothetical protein